MPSLLSESPPTPHSIFPVGVLEGMKSLCPTVQPVVGNPFPAQKGGSVPLSPSALHTTEASTRRVTASATPMGVFSPTQPEVWILSEHLRLCAPTSGQSLSFSHWIPAGTEPRLSWEQSALAGMRVFPGTSGKAFAETVAPTGPASAPA